MIKSLAELKRTLSIGTKLTMVRNDWAPNGRLIDVKRSIISKNSVGVVLNIDPTETDGSHLNWPPARRVSFTEGGFIVQLDDIADGPSMEYEFEPTGDNDNG